MTSMAKEQTQPEVTLRPRNDQVLVKLDVRTSSVIKIAGPNKGGILPSGKVLAVGPGRFVPGTGEVQPLDIQVGDHVAVELRNGDAWMAVPLSTDEDDLYVLISEMYVTGVLHGAESRDSVWWKRSSKALDEEKIVRN